MNAMNVSSLQAINAQLSSVKVVRSESDGVGNIALTDGKNTVTVIEGASSDLAKTIGDALDKALDTTIGKLTRKNNTAIRKELQTALKDMSTPRTPKIAVASDTTVTSSTEQIDAAVTLAASQEHIEIEMPSAS